MFIRKDPGITLGEARDLLNERSGDADALRVSPEDIAFHLDATDPVIALGETEVPATEEALAAFGDLLSIPSSFYNRASQKVTTTTMSTFLNEMLSNTLQKDARVTVKNDRLLDIDEWGKEGLNGLQVVNAAINVLTEDAPVARWIDTPGFMGFDAYVPEGFAHGYGGEGVTPYADGNERDDITAGGLRFGLDLKRGLAPFVQTWLFRLGCTNGYEIEKAGLKIDARGQSVDQVIAELEEMAQIAFGEVERDIASFYELKNTPVDNVERALHQIARERNLPARSTMALIGLATSEDVPDNASMFDVVNLVTNYANSPAVRNDGGRLLLEGAGGAVITDHAARCGHCQQRVV